MLEGLTRASATARSCPCLTVCDRAFGVVAAAILGFLTIAVSAAQAETLTIQGSSTASSNLLDAQPGGDRSQSGQSLKIVSIRSDIGLLRLLARQAEFAVISTSLQHAIDRSGPTTPTCPTTG